MLGLNENRGEALHDISLETITRRMKAYYDPVIHSDEIRALHPGLVTNAASFDAGKTRLRLQRDSKFQEGNLRRFVFKPFDVRWAYIERSANLWNRVRPDLLNHASRPNHFILARRNVPKFPDGSTLFACTHLADQHVLHTDAYFIPLRLCVQGEKQDQGTTRSMVFSVPDSSNDNWKPNLSIQARAYLKKLGVGNPDRDPEAAKLTWMHVLAIGYSSAYLVENADGIRQDWPRIPLPKAKKLLLESAALGEQIANILDTESPVEGVTGGNLRSELKSLATPARTDAGNLKDAELALTAGWGHAGQAGVTMPGQGKLIERDYSNAEREAIASGAKPLGLSVEQMFSLLGPKTCDIYLNDVAYWANVPAKVWDYTIGGYQVIKKWLSYREEKILGRALTKEEVRYVQEMVRRIAAILLLGPALDASYRAVKADTFPWPSGKS